MNKGELVEAVARQMGSSKAEAERALVAVTACIAAGLKTGGEVAIQGFGSFRVTRRPARTARNPKTLELIEIGPSKSVGFRAGRALRDLL
ncbi:MAG: HU family DNA-binding protein [Planctomycetes bacterium]|nr:HU family DNA-binding protein [Planctomycetota bacterium]